MKRIVKEELPEELNTEIINILVNMALESPKTTFDWAEISELLEERGQLMFILDKVEQRKKATEQAAEDAKSKKQKLKEKEEWQEFLKNVDPKKFYGNMGEPETPKEFKDKYGVWPPGYNKG